MAEPEATTSTNKKTDEIEVPVGPEVERAAAAGGGRGRAPARLTSACGNALVGRWKGHG